MLMYLDKKIFKKTIRNNLNKKGIKKNQKILKRRSIENYFLESLCKIISPLVS